MTSNGNRDVGLKHETRTEKTLLLPFSRRLRHLQGITLRNLILVPAQKGAKGRAFDDEALPFSLKSPAKLLAMKEHKAFGHSRSHSDIKLKDKSDYVPSAPSSQSTETAKLSSPQRPTLGKTPRKSFMEPSLQGAKTRRDKLDDAIVRHIAEIFFTLHVPELKDPIYISEVQKAMNPNFRFFDLSACSAAITRLNTLTVKVWAKYGTLPQWHYLIELPIPLTSLQYMGKSIDNFYHPLPENSIIFHLTDGVYTSFNDMGGGELTVSSRLQYPSRGSPLINNHVESTSSYDGLMRLSTLDACIQDAIVTRENLIADINKLVTSDKDRFTSSSLLESSRNSLARIKRAITTERKNVRASRARLFSKRESLAERREAMKNSLDAQNTEAAHVSSADSKLLSCQGLLAQVSDDTLGQRRRICEDILLAYPIEAIADSALQFTIRGLALPNSTFPSSLTGTLADAIAAAFGHVAHVVYLLSFYLGVALPYPVQPCSSVSTVRDPISLMATSNSSTPGTATTIIGLTTSAVTRLVVPARTFPLFTKNAGPFFRFEYAVFLLNKDIELICERLGLKVLDIRQTLPNLKYALFVATAGSGELPARKAGGLRGSLRTNGPNVLH